MHIGHESKRLETAHGCLGDQQVSGPRLGGALLVAEFLPPGSDHKLIQLWPRKHRARRSRNGSGQGQQEVALWAILTYVATAPNRHPDATLAIDHQPIGAGRHLAGDRKVLKALA